MGPIIVQTIVKGLLFLPWLSTFEDMNWSSASYCARIYAATVVTASLVIVFTNYPGELAISDRSLLVYIFYYLSQLCMGLLYLLPAFLVLTLIAVSISYTIEHANVLKLIVAASISALIFITGTFINAGDIGAPGFLEPITIYTIIAALYAAVFTLYPADEA